MCFRVHVLFGFSTLSLIHVVQAEMWRRYNNERFGTSVEVPADFTAQPPLTNNDGRTFMSKDGRARILVYGSNICTPGGYEAAVDGLTIAVR